VLNLFSSWLFGLWALAVSDDRPKEEVPLKFIQPLPLPFVLFVLVESMMMIDDGYVVLFEELEISWCRCGIVIRLTQKICLLSSIHPAHKQIQCRCAGVAQVLTVVVAATLG